MRICVIFNPVARGEKARRFRRHLDQIGSQSSLKLTTAPGDARRLATEAVREGFDTVVAAGGDGTLNEVLNGIGDANDGFARVRLGVLPLGTVNVFARELLIPTKLDRAWKLILQGHETKIDLPSAQYADNGTVQRRYFAQLAGAGLDARAVELVHWGLKKKVGPLAYIWAGLQALRDAPAKIDVALASSGAAAADRLGPETGALVLIGNGRRYGGEFRLFPEADLRDGLLDICVFPSADWFTLARCGPSLLLRGRLPASAARCLQAQSFTLSAPAPVPFEVDGELIGRLPATFSVEPARLRVIVPD